MQSAPASLTIASIDADLRELCRRLERAERQGDVELALALLNDRDEMLERRFALQDDGR